MKAAVMIYPNFSMQEISCLTDALKVFYEVDIDVFASNKDIIVSEDNFQVIANKTFEEFDVSEYNCLILPGIYNPLPALFNEQNIEFLKTLKDQDILICSISSSPMLLAKAGLLDHTQYTCGVWDEIEQFLEFMPKQNRVHQPLIKDGNVITAIGFAFREFAQEVIRTLGIDECKAGLFNPVNREYADNELVFKMGEENFLEFKEEYEQFLLK